MFFDVVFQRNWLGWAGWAELLDWAGLVRLGGSGVGRAGDWAGWLGC